MAYSELPSAFRVKDKKFQIGFRQQMTPSADGFIQVINRTSPLWWAEFTTPPLLGSTLDKVQAFIDTMDGSINSFLAYDPGRIMPSAYKELPFGADPWSSGVNSIILTAVDYANGTVTLSGFKNTAIVSPSDLFCVFTGNAWYLFRVVEPAPVTVSSGSAVFKVRPRPTFTTTGLPVRYQKAVAEMKIIGKVDESSSVGEGTIFSFKAAQFINRAIS